jgi:hypothetical protein
MQASWNMALAHEVNAHAFTNPGVPDLLASMGTVDPALPARMAPWLYSAGFPVVLVDVSAAGVINITQV